MVQAETTPAQSERPQIGDLPHLLGTIPVKEFFESVWNKRSLYLRGDTDKFCGLFDKAAFYRALESCTDLKIGYTDERGWPAHQKIHASQVAEMLASGKTVCASSIEAGNYDLKKFLGRIEKPFALLGRFLFNAYLSPDGAGFGLHLDHHPVFILQIEGRKRWWYSPEPALKRVITNISFPDSHDSLQLPWVSVSRPPEDSLRCKCVTSATGRRSVSAKGFVAPCEGNRGITGANPRRGIGCAAGSHPARAGAPPKHRRTARQFAWLFDRELFDKEMPRDLEEIFEGALERLKVLLGSITARDLYNLWKHGS